MRIHPSFASAIQSTLNIMQCARAVRTDFWQGMDIRDKPEMEMYEILNHSFSVGLVEDLTRHQMIDQIKPNMPWAEDHFQERVGGDPLNPGVQWAKWPYAASADRFRTEGQKFTHTYMERYWPKGAGLEEVNWHKALDTASGLHNVGIRYEYGDLNDVLDLLARDPFGRQAFLPVWFPEDTGVIHGGRVPCTLGYHFMRRENVFYTKYYIRSCDFVRHFRDDIYLTHRLSQWVLERLRNIDPPKWNLPFNMVFSMDIVSLHCFKNDFRLLQKQAHS